MINTEVPWLLPHQANWRARAQCMIGAANLITGDGARPQPPRRLMAPCERSSRASCRCILPWHQPSLLVVLLLTRTSSRPHRISTDGRPPPSRGLPSSAPAIVECRVSCHSRRPSPRTMPCAVGSERASPGARAPDGASAGLTTCLRVYLDDRRGRARAPLRSGSERAMARIKWGFCQDCPGSFGRVSQERVR